MNITHLHLLTNHVPVLGSVFGMVLLGIGLLRKNRTLSNAGLITCIITGLAAIPVFFTGEGAEETVEGIAGIGHGIIESHEEAALVALWLALALGAASLITFALQTLKRTNFKWLPIIPLALSIVVFASMAWVGYLGGQIRHTELKQASAQYNIPIDNSPEDHEDD